MNVSKINLFWHEFVLWFVFDNFYKMRKLNSNEKLIVREIIKNPRISDNQISKNVKIPLKTVNRKRKELEEENLLFYFARLNNSKEGTKLFNAKQMYIITFRNGITRKQYLDTYYNEKYEKYVYSKHINTMHLGEIKGNLAVIMIIESYQNEDILEIFNAEIVPDYENLFGKNCIKDTTTINLSSVLKMLHYYMPNKNMEKGLLKKNWPNENIFVGD
jgi:DNA-binding Lrp family transcriptional regulator